MAEESIDVRIVTINGEEFSASVSFHDKVAVVKRQLALAMKIPRYRLKLSHREMLLDDQACFSFSVKPVTQPVHLSVAVLPDSGDVTEEQMAEFWEAFSMIDKPADSKITAKELGIAMRAVGQKPTQEELDDLLLDFPNGSIPFQAFVAMVTSKRQDDDEESLIEEFKRWHEPDSSGFIGIEEFRHVLVNSGDKFSEEEIDEIIREVGVTDEGQVNYMKFVQMLADT